MEKDSYHLPSTVKAVVTKAENKTANERDMKVGVRTDTHKVFMDLGQKVQLVEFDPDIADEIALCLMQCAAEMRQAKFGGI